MRVLLAAYEYPPSPSPQSLRWAYLARELDRAGAHVTVLTPATGGVSEGLPCLVRDRVLRTWPGPVMGLVGWLRSLSRPAAPPTEAGNASSRQARTGPTTLNWKGVAVEHLQSRLGAAMFPDIRREWNPWAKHALRRQLASDTPDVVVTSHEPASVLLLGREARAAGIPWVADLGDPILAPYTPKRWRRRAHRLEALVCAQADHITVTTEATRELLVDRHGVSPDRVTVVTQGFDQDAAEHRVGSGSGSLELLYSGSLYDFRRPDALIDAVIGTPGVRLSIASRRVPDRLVELHQRHPESLELLGALPHSRVLQAQRAADVLVDLGNDQAEQVPGKFYEYLGASRPVLHVGSGSSASASLLEALKRGWHCDPDAAQIGRLLSELVTQKAAGTLGAGLDLRRSTVLPYSWQALAQQMLEVLAKSQASTINTASPGHQRTHQSKF